MNIGFLALENCMKSSITGPFDILSVASIEWGTLYSHSTSSLFNPMIISNDGLPVTCFNGMKIDVQMKRDDCNDLDMIFIPVIYGNLDHVLTDEGLIHWLQDQNKKGVITSAVCAGVFPLAETGLLNHRTATTHWQLAPAFQSRYPNVNLKKEKIIVDEGNLITAGGVTAYMDLALYITGRFGSWELTSMLSKTLLIDPSRRSQSPYTAFDFITNHGDEAILQVQNWMKRNITEAMSVTMLADKAGLGQRTFTRRFKKATGDTPLVYLQQLRIGKARMLLETTKEPFDSITYESGYDDISSFRRLFKRTTGLSPTAYRKKFTHFLEF